MGAFHPKRTLSPTHPWKQTQTSKYSLVFSACRTIVVVLLAGVIGMSLLKFLPSEPNVTSRQGSNTITEPTVIVDGVGHVVNYDDWHENDNRIYLAAVIFNRVFKEDLFNITAYECKQWIEYMLFAGVEHIFWYDTAHSDEESQEAHLLEYVKKGLLTYHRFHLLFPGNVEAGYHFEQDHSYEHFLTTSSATTKWVVEMDVDEYPFMVSNVKRSFLKRYVQYIEKSRPDVTQILMPCMIFGGNPQSDEVHDWVIERYQRRKRATEGVRAGFASRTKPIFQPKHARGVSLFDPHQFPMKSGDTLVTAPEVLRMNHYWGARLSDFKPDTAAVKALLVPDDSAQVIANEIKSIVGTRLYRGRYRRKASVLRR